MTRGLEAGTVVRVLSAASCASGLPDEDQARLQAIVGQLRPVAEIDRDGFVWLSFDAGIERSDFCLGPSEVEVIERPFAVCDDCPLVGSLTSDNLAQST